MSYCGDETDIQVGQIARILRETLDLHNDRATKPQNRIRKGDGLPYGIHPTFGTLMIVHEASIPLPRRLILAEAFSKHDLLEDTTATVAELERILNFPESLPLIIGLTFDEGVDTTEEAIRRGPEIAMLKSFDAVCNLFGLAEMDESIWPREKKLRRIVKAKRLFDYVQPHYPDLQIWCIGRAIIERLEKLIPPV